VTNQKVWKRPTTKALVYEQVVAAGDNGITLKECCALITGSIGGQLSGPLSTLHTDGAITRLAGTDRDGYKIYMLPERALALGLPTEEPDHNKGAAAAQEVVVNLKYIRDLLSYHDDKEFVIRTIDKIIKTYKNKEQK
jgi:hypothetical protein